MLYRLLLWPARIFIHLFFRKIIINKKNILRSKGPLLIASNHPNSFLDAIILACIFKKPIYSLARGDVFINPFVSKLLKSLHILPVYRLSEGAQNLGNNYATFEACREIFKQNGIVLIFSEAGSINEWHLRPLKKGTARLAIASWQQNIDLAVLPTGINYSNFRKLSKTVFINFGNSITKEKIPFYDTDGKSIGAFNEVLKTELQQQVFEIDTNDMEKRKEVFHLYQPNFKKIILFIPAMIGMIIHFHLYYIIRLMINKSAQDHYDSIMMGLLFFTYPFYIILIALLVYLFTHSILFFIAAIILLPILCFCLLRYKEN